MKYSFVIPTYNKKRLLKRTLEALDRLEGFGADQYEAVVIDDGSDEDVFSFIKDVNTGCRLNYIYLDRCPHSCRSRSRNYGINAARGKYIVFIDDDIVVGKDYLQQLQRYYDFSDNLAIVGTRINCPEGILERHPPEDLKAIAFDERNAPEMLEERHLTFNSLSYNLAAQQYPWMMSATCSLSLPRKLSIEAGGFDEAFNKWGYEDLELGCRLFKNGVRFVVNPKLLAFHQYHPRAQAGENNFQYFIEKCKGVFDHIEPIKLLALYGLNFNTPSRLKIYRKYKGAVNNRETIVFRDKQELAAVKKQILESLKQKGCEITVQDHVEDTELDIWIQLLEVEEGLVNYVPQSFTISRAATFALLNNALVQNREHTNKTDESGEKR